MATAIEQIGRAQDGDATSITSEPRLPRCILLVQRYASLAEQSSHVRCIRTDLPSRGANADRDEHRCAVGQRALFNSPRAGW